MDGMRNAYFRSVKEKDKCVDLVVYGEITLRWI
jgi:hypothetical protein